MILLPAPLPMHERKVTWRLIQEKGKLMGEAIHIAILHGGKSRQRRKKKRRKKCYHLSTSSIITAIADSPLGCGLFHLRRLDFDVPAKVHGLTSRHPRLDSHSVHDSAVTSSAARRPQHRLVCHRQLRPSLTRCRRRLSRHRCVNYTPFRLNRCNTAYASSTAKSF